MRDNPVIFQGFEWYLPADQRHYKRLLSVLPHLHAIGVTALWLPPACKAGNSTGNGYDVYDLYDLGEFEQRGSQSTKWGPKGDLMDLAKRAKELGVELIFDAVLNHRCGGDGKETVVAVEVHPNNRLKDLCEPREVETWLKFDFSGRGGQYSDVKYDWNMFNASDWDDRTQSRGIFKIKSGGKDWAKDVSKEWGNGDYLMFNNCDYTNKVLSKDVKNWGVWVTKELGLGGFRLDAMQHFSHNLSMDFIKYVRDSVQDEGRDVFFVGEYWSGDVDILDAYLEKSLPDLHLYDAPLLYNMAMLSWDKKPDLRTVFERTLVCTRPDNAVTLVMNHDTQKGQVMESPISPSFTPLAYALILFREAGYPCVFYGDMYGICEPHAQRSTCGGKLADLILARKLYAYGEQEDYFLNPELVGWVRRGVDDEDGSMKAGMAVVMHWSGPPNHAPALSPSSSMSSNRPEWIRKLSDNLGKFKPPSSGRIPSQKMKVGREHAGEIWTDILCGSKYKVVIGRDGCGVFPCPKNTLTVYVKEGVDGRERFPVGFARSIEEHRGASFG
ncbi:glycoside hydrolase family 13 protein [Pleomassaria siparia CBS 279.74]|uniref:Glycoside hydrolase family 13 protein n=1 Tax=Pleomassaria siparia CBS 279.74 TaxID=1314801 RepID=A0A6G1KQZ8_9PLEO|nr:glycoside hydrolase family 13 protein [Pleomassaria siparia CBS 279.74]